MPKIDDRHKADLDELGKMLGRYAENHRRLDSYTEGAGPIPDAVSEAGVTKAYRLLMPLADAPFGATVVEAVCDRLEVTGIDSGDDTLDKLLWEDWRRNQMDAESPLAHNSTLTGGRSYATVWPDADGNPTITLDSAENMVVKYAEGSRTVAQVAMRRWTDSDGRLCANLYYPDGIYKFIGPQETTFVSSTIEWQPRDVLGEPWPLPNGKLNGVVPVVEIATNRKLKPGPWPYARGEFEHCAGVIDRIHLLTFLGLVVAFYMGFPLRGVIGEKILRDDDGMIIPPFDVNADKGFQLENPEAKLAEYQAADRGNLSVYEELEHLATVSNTPRHYFPMASGGSNVSSDTVVAWEAGLHGKVSQRHQPQMGGGWESVFRRCALIRDAELAPTAQVRWADHETRSLAERADAASKLKDILPWQAVAEAALNANADQIAQWEAQRGSDAMTSLLAAAQPNAVAAG